MNFFTRRIFIIISLFLILISVKLDIQAQSNDQIARATEVPEKTSPVVVLTTVQKTENNQAPIFYRVGVSQAQTEPLSLTEAIRRALQNNNSIEVARDDVRFQETQLRSLRGFYNPVLTVNPTFTRNSTTGSEPTQDFRLNSDVTQFIRQTGGSYSVFFNNSRTENRFAQAQLTAGSTLVGSTNSPTYSSSLGFQFNQPILRNFRIDNQRRQIKIQRKRLQQSDADFRRQTIDTISQVQRSYWDLVFALRDMQNKIANLNLSRENLRQIEARIEAGASAPLARAEVATELANREAEVLTATEQVTRAENTLKQLILADPNAPEWSESLVPTDEPVFSLDPLDLNVALQEAVQNRSELRRLRLQKEINAIDIDYFRNQTKPQVDLNSTFSLGGFARGTTNEAIRTNLFTSQQDLLFLDRINKLVSKTQGINPQVPISPIENSVIVIPAQNPALFGNFGQSLQNLFRSDAPSYSVGVTFSFPLGNQTARANLAGAKILQEQNDTQLRLEEQRVIAEVRNAVQAVETARQRVMANRRAVENAEIQLEGERKLFEVGRSTNFLLFQRENTLTNARNALIRAETDYNKALADLQRATSTTFRVNNIQVESPTEEP